MKTVMMMMVLFATNCERPEPVVISGPVVVPPPDPQPTPVEEEPEPEPEREAPKLSCGTACLNLQLLGCEVAADTPEGSKCKEICENSFQIPALAWDVEALTRTETCPR